MPQPRTPTTNRIDSLMESASRALVQRRYFECERLCVEALERAFVAADYERMARILLPLEESRRQKRDIAFDAGHVCVVNDGLPVGRQLKAGCYLLTPPRVGVDGRMLREAANKKKVPIIVVVREPTSRDGMWPVVSIGPVTIRTKVRPPSPEAPHAANGQPPVAKRSRVQAAADAAPPPNWFLGANEAIGDKAIAGAEPSPSPLVRVEVLFKALQAHPDHEKLHQELAEACRAAAKVPVKTVRPRVVKLVRTEDADE